MDAQFSDQELESARVLFAGECSFVRGVVKMSGLPEPNLPEIAFAGRSNVGKSSLINALTGRKALARTSNTPGRTRELNFFDLGKKVMLVDLPGYGYARVSREDVKRWTSLVRAYLAGRAVLRRVCLLIDARRGVMETDNEVMALLDEAAVSFQLVLTKTDKLKPAALERLIEETQDQARKHPAAYPEIRATSSNSGAGIPELRATIAGFATSAS